MTSRIKCNIHIADQPQIRVIPQQQIETKSNLNFPNKKPKKLDLKIVKEMKEIQNFEKYKIPKKCKNRIKKKTKEKKKMK